MKHRSEYEFMNKTRSLLAGGIGIAALIGQSQGAVMALIDQDIPIPTNFSGVVVNLETGETSNAASGLDGGDVNFVFGGLGVTNDAFESDTEPSWQPVRTGTGNADPIEALGLGDVVGPTSVYSTGFGGSDNNFVNFTPGVRQYVGFSVVLEDTTLAYGWMEVTLQNNDTPGVIHSWAYEDTGVPLGVGLVPEPSGSALLVIAMGLTMTRRKRKS